MDQFMLKPYSYYSFQSRQLLHELRLVHFYSSPYSSIKITRLLFMDQILCNSYSSLTHLKALTRGSILILRFIHFYSFWDSYSWISFKLVLLTVIHLRLLKNGSILSLSFIHINSYSSLLILITQVSPWVNCQACYIHLPSSWVRLSTH